MSAEQLKKGDVVQLKSGGPAMTIITFHEDGDAKCKWFEGSKVHEDWFPPYALMKLPESQGTKSFKEIIQSGS